ncbi:MAG: hypothetical protein Q8R04_04030 [Nanoarchaeota archaeon]|nr:hypothetical protein [Nanoarchaeota archaeon]
MKIDIDINDIEDFKGLLGKIKNNHELDSSNHTLKIYCLNSELTRQELFSYLSRVHGKETQFINDFSMTHLNPETPDEIIFYCYKDSQNNIVFIFSITGKSKIDMAIERLMRFLPKTYYFWIPLHLFEKLKEEIIDKYDKENVFINYFSSLRSDYHKIDCTFRPHISRKIIYEGDDGLEVLRELKTIYGILPRKIGFSIGTKLQFSIDHRNTFIIEYGFPYLNYIWEIIDLSLQKYAGVHDVLADVRFEKIKSDGIFDFNVHPLRIKFSQPKVYEDVTTFFELLENDELGEGRYCVLNPLIKEGSLFFSAMILDSNKNSILTVSGDENEMTVLPHSNCGKDVLSRFYEQIDLNFDTNTKVIR